jgi:hypothetical protein
MRTSIEELISPVSKQFYTMDCDCFRADRRLISQVIHVDSYCSLNILT